MDFLTEIGPPSRFLEEDLNNFTLPLPQLPSPILIFSNPKPNIPLRPSHLIIAISPASHCLFHNISSKTLIGSLILPEVPLSGNSIEPSLKDKSCNIYSFNTSDNSILVVSVQCSIAAERSHMVAKLLIGNDIIPERVLVLDTIQSRNFRGKLSLDETIAFKLETSCMRRTFADSGEDFLLRCKELSYFPSGSLLDGLSAALLARCEIRNVKGTVCVSWPEYGSSVGTTLKSLINTKLLPALDMAKFGDAEDEYLNSGIKKEYGFERYS